MKQVYKIALMVSVFPVLVAGQNGITYTDSGRFGDCLMTYYRVKWLAWKYKLRFLYKPFVYSDQLKMHEYELWFDNNKKNYKNTMRLDDEAVGVQSHGSLLYLCTYFTHYKDWSSWDKGLYPLIALDKSFVAHLRTMVRPRIAIPSLPIPPGALSIAVHVRKGGGFDKPLLTEEKSASQARTPHNYVDVAFPLKFPPDEFYIKHIEYIAQEFPNKPLYVYLFTDDRAPQRLATKYEQALNNPRITFDYRKAGNLHNAHVIEDFFCMQQCDCLIRPDSSFSKAAQMLTDYKLVIYPEHAVWQGNRLIVDKVAYERE